MFKQWWNTRPVTLAIIEVITYLGGILIVGFWIAEGPPLNSEGGIFLAAFIGVIFFVAASSFFLSTGWIGTRLGKAYAKRKKKKLEVGFYLCQTCSQRFCNEGHCPDCPGFPRLVYKKEEWRDN